VELAVASREQLMGCNGSTVMPRRRAMRVIGPMLVAVLCGACLGDKIDSDTDPAITIDAAEIALQPGSSARVHIDVRDYTDSRGVPGYQTTFDEIATGIAISTSDCLPPDAGTAWCEEWTITAPVDVLPGEYTGEVRAIGNAVPIEPANLIVIVLPPPSLHAPPAIEVDGTEDSSVATEGVTRHTQQTLVITKGGTLWGAGENSYGPLRNSSLTISFDESAPTVAGGPVQPGHLDSAVPLFGSIPPANPDPGPTWKQVASHGTHTIALRDNGTIWAWGYNRQGGLGFARIAGLRGIQLEPRQVPGVSGISAISTLRSSGFGFAGSLALANDRTVYAWGDNFDGDTEEENGVFVPQQVPATLDANRNASPLTNVRAIAGGAAQNGRGSAAALKWDGSVWTWGRTTFIGPPDGESRNLPRQVTGLPDNVQALAMSGDDRTGIGLAMLDDGRVFSFPSDKAAGDAAPAAAPVAGLTNVIQIAAGNALGYALRRDGRVLHWRIGENTPRLVEGLQNVMSIGVGHAIVRSGCTNGGEVWRINAGGAVTRVADFSNGPGCSRALQELTVVKNGNSSGRVLSQYGEVDCGTRCANFVLADSVITLHALPPLGTYAVWDSAQCPGGNVRMKLATTCTVTFNRAQEPQFTLMIEKQGEGRVTSSVDGIDCGNDCSQLWPRGTVVTLHAAPSPGWAFYGFGGPADCSDGVIALGQDVACTATFVLPILLQVSVSGQGNVRSSPAGIDCGVDCRERFALGAAVNLIPEPASGWTFARFTGSPGCAAGNLVMSDAQTCTAHFVPVAPPAAPTGLAADASNGPVQLRWDSRSDANSYELTRTPGNNGDATRVAAFAGPANSYVDSAVASDTLYSYALVARNVAGSSAATSVSVRTTVAANWTRVGANDIDIRAAFAQPALALAPDGNTVAVAQVFATGGLDQTQVFRNDAISSSTPWARLNSTPGGALMPAAPSAQPSITLDSQGSAVVAWTQVTPGGNDVRVARYDNAAGQWVQLGDVLDIALGASLNDAVQPQLVLDADERPVVAWLQAGSVYVKRWSGSGWTAVGSSVTAQGDGVNAIRLVLDASGAPVVLLRRGSGSATQLLALRESAGAWTALGGALNAPLVAPRDTLQFFDLLVDVDGSLLAMWSEGLAPHTVLARRWRNGAWQPLPSPTGIENNYAITGLALARGTQSPPTPPVLMLTRQPVFAGANTRNAYGDVYLLQSDAWTQRPTLITFGPMLGLTLRVTRQATPIAAWLAETGAPGSGELRLYVWRGL
jgi:hypothetical protein